MRTPDPVQDDFMSQEPVISEEETMNWCKAETFDRHMKSFHEESSDEPHVGEASDMSVDEHYSNPAGANFFNYGNTLATP